MFFELPGIGFLRILTFEKIFKSVATEKKNQGLKMYLHTYTKELSMFIAILFIVAKDWEKPKCPQQELLK